MRLHRLTISELRCLRHAELSFGSSLVLFTGANGAGKTSVLEALHVLGYGRSFRGRVRDGLVRTGAAAIEVFAEWTDAGERRHRAGLRHAGKAWEGRVDGEAVPSLASLCAAFPVVSFEPGSHELIAGGGEHRRRFLDWALFHVEPAFEPVWRRFARALKQRNALLKRRPGARELAPWDQELAEAGDAMTRMREAYLDRLAPVTARVAAAFLPELGEARCSYAPGWRREDMPLADALLLAQERDLLTGYTSVGPHRADWRLDFASLPGREALSRGQEKLTALSCLLSQAEAFAEDRGEWPLVCLDDLASELDRTHQAHVLRRLAASGAQVFITGTDIPPALEALDLPFQQFHVEQGELRPGAAST